MFWILSDLQSLFIGTPVGAMTFLIGMLFYDQFLLVPARYLVRLFKGTPQPRKDELPSGLLVIPSLLRAVDELEAIKATMSNVIQNDYPGKMIIVASIDGTNDAPKLYEELVGWFAAQQSTLPEGVWLYITGTPGRRGKPLAIEHAVRFVQDLVASGEHAEFPKIYFSTDADADLGAHALEHLARRLTKKGFFTRTPGRAVAGNLHVRDHQYWQGWRHFFTVEGQLTLQVARDYMVSNMRRFNLGPLPISGIPGALYCTWTDILLAGPHFMGFMKTLNRTDWIRWWLGHAPPKFSESKATPIPELLAGDTDDTVSAFLAVLSRWENGRLTLDAPRTPLHAFFYMLRTLFFDRGLRYEPAAHVYTSSPSTLGSLWRQRMRWNASRIEVSTRFSSSFRYHWDLGVSCAATVSLMLKCLVFGTFAYVTAPLSMGKSGILLPIALGMGVQIAFNTLSVVLALLIDGSFVSKWRLLLAIPMATFYNPIYGFWAGAAGMSKDVFGTGNVTKFAPESTLIAGRSVRIALFARLRRAAVLMVRSVVYGDVPLGLFWLGWNETAYTPSGFKGWTTGKKPTLMDRLRFGAELAAPAAATPQRASLIVPAPAASPALARVSIPAPARVPSRFPSLVPAPMASFAVPPEVVRSSVVTMRSRRSSLRPAPISIAPPSQRAA